MTRVDLDEAKGEPVDPEAIDAQTAHDWGTTGRVGFRFLFAYLILNLFPFPLPYVPVVGYRIAKPWGDLWDRIVPWVGQRLFGMQVATGMNGSGDRAFNYVEAACHVALAAAIAAAWSLVDRRRAGYPRLLDLLRIYVRYSVAVTMISYGGVKVIKTQFPDPSPSRLIQPLGDFSPMGLLWTFMGWSTGYTMFTGAAEMLGGLLLVSRHTALLGALISGGVMVNVLVLNLCYDVPVKLFSSHLILMCLFIAAPDLRRLIDFFVLGRAPGPVHREKLFRRPLWDGIGVAVRTAAFGWVIYSTLSGAQQMRRMYTLAPRVAQHGVWDVEEFAIDGKEVPAGDPRRWRRVVFDDFGRVVLMTTLTPDGKSVRARAQIDAEKKTIRALTAAPNPSVDYTYEQPESDRLTLEGASPGPDKKPVKIRARLKRFETGDFLLQKRGFRWISDMPYNR